MLASHTLSELSRMVGQEISVSDWIAMPQERIQLFADATGDHQWIHVDAERCRRDSPFHTTVAHGFLTLSLLPVMMGPLCTPPDARATLNYGVNKVRFPAPVPVNSRLRGRTTLLAIESLPDCRQTTWQIMVEREGSDKPVCVAELLLRHYDA